MAPRPGGAISISGDCCMGEVRVCCSAVQHVQIVLSWSRSRLASKVIFENSCAGGKRGRVNDGEVAPE